MSYAELYVFGSITSGAVDTYSDIDVLAVSDSQNQTEAIPKEWSVYSSEKLESLFARGTLFAWHLHRDAIQVWPRNRPGLLARLGPPAPYSEAVSEIAALLALGEATCDEIRNETPSLVFEFGLLYLVSRDIAMAAAPAMLGDFCFSRNTPFEIMTPKFPLSSDEYHLLMTCRRASTRGIPVVLDAAAIASVRAKLDDLRAWFSNLHKAVRDGSVSR
jgi:hypothetical protein